MMLSRNLLHYALVLAAAAILLTSCGRKKYENRITKDTQQPDKVLYDAAIDDLEKSRFQRARLTLQTLMNTYDTSEYMAKAKLAIADSWYREGGANGYAQAQAEYKDFILFYPNMEESAEAQIKICQMEYNQLEKPDRDATHALRTEEECRQALNMYPNSKFAPQAQQMVRNVQEVLAEKEFKVGSYYLTKGSPSPAANRLLAVADQYPLYSKADEALWSTAIAYQRMGDRFENQQAAAYTRIVKDYPLSPRVEAAKAMLEQMKRPIPEADPVAYTRMKYELENRTNRSLLGKVWGPFSSRPDMSPAAKSGTPQMTGFRPQIPLTVPDVAAGRATSGEVVAVTPEANVIDKNPDARANPGAAQPATAATETPAATTAPATQNGNGQSKAPTKQNNKKKKQEKPAPPPAKP